VSADIPVVVDTNIIFSALLRGQTRFADILLRSDSRFFICESVLVELFRHKEKMVAASRLDPDEVVQLYQTLLHNLNVEKESLIEVEHRHKATDLCRDVDPADAPMVALTLSLDGLLWTGDRRLRRGLEERGFDRFFDPAA
jgi:predicted nucleic acid-binding protein